MKRTLRADEARVWALVASTVRPGRGCPHPPAPDAPAPERLTLQAWMEGEAQSDAHAAPAAADATPSRRAVAPYPKTRPTPGGAGAGDRAEGPMRAGAERSHGRAHPASGRPMEPHRLEPHPIEPLRRRRIVRERDVIGARLDLHGLDQERARTTLHAFLQRAHAQGHRAVLVITGKGALGDGVLRRRAPEWLIEPGVRPLIAGVSQADRRHGGAGALYIALKRRQA